jgi:hypothetical protein
MRAITLYCDLVGGAVLTGLQAELVAKGQDIGEAEEVPMEQGLNEEPLLSEPVKQSEGKDNSGTLSVKEPEAEVLPADQVDK